MGAGIAYVAANAGYAVELVEVDPARASAALQLLHGWWDKAVARGRLSEGDAREGGTRVGTATTVAELTGGPDVVVEAVPERLELKHQVLSSAERLVPALLASNTSSIPIGSL